MAVDGTTAEGMWKDVFGQLENTVPDSAVLANDIPFKEQAKTGKNYIFPVRLRRGHGVTFAGGATALTAFTLNAVASGQTDDATVASTSFVGRESFAYTAVARGMSNGKQAFADVFADGVEDLFTTAGFYLEALLHYGQTSFGTFNEAGPNATTATLDLTVASTAPGLLAGLEGAYIDVYSDTAFGTKRNATNPILITGFLFDAGTGIGQLSLSGTASDIDAIAVGDVFVPKGWYNSAHMSFAGLDKILLNTGSLFGIDAATYPTWGGTTYDVGTAAISMLKVIKAGVNIAVRCPMMSEALRCYVSPMTWTDLNNNHAALRRMAESTKGGLDLGTTRITYYSNVGTRIEIVSDPMMKGGEAFMGFMSALTRGGASEPTFNLNKEATGQAPRFVRELPDNAGFEIRCYWDQFLIARKPKALVKLINIVNNV